MAGPYTELVASFGAGGACTYGCFVKQTAEETVLLNDVAGGWCPGVACYDVPSAAATAGSEVSVYIGGISIVIWGGGTAVAIGDRLASDNQGRAVKAVSTNVVLGVAERASTGLSAGDQILINLEQAAPLVP